MGDVRHAVLEEVLSSTDNSTQQRGTSLLQSRVVVQLARVTGALQTYLEEEAHKKSEYWGNEISGVRHTVRRGLERNSSGPIHPGSRSRQR